MISNDVAKYWVKDNIVYGKFVDGALIDLEAAKDIIRIRLLLQAGNPMPLLMDIRGLKELSKLARDFLGSPKGLEKTSAGVLLTNKSIFVRTIGNIYFKLTNPSIPHKMFSEEAKAIEWLNKFK